jgi:exodeoxyribonuclease-5
VNHADLILRELKFTPTAGQAEAINNFVRFLQHPDPRAIFILRGYAGTGKTTLISALVRALPKFRMKSILLAPTGRAAKVISNYSGKQAFTIHRKIYRTGTADEGFVSLQGNANIDTVFIVDEASMIGEGGSDRLQNGTNLLEDLFTYVNQGENCKLLLVGDTAQLPPVGLSYSPALDPAYLKRLFRVPVGMTELTEVMRQELDSGVLLNATRLRLSIAEDSKQFPEFQVAGYEDLIRVSGTDLIDALEESYRKNGADETIVICRSNKRANLYNQQIRARIRWQEDEISIGDHIMIVKNNYYWLPKESRAGFIANGDTAEIVAIRKYYNFHGFRFADVTIRLLDYPEEAEFDARIILDTLTAESPALTSPQQQQLFESVAADYADAGSKGAIYRKMKEDPFFNALQVKFAYAVTCHKAQGGQWNTVFIEQGYITEEMINADFQRWLYTALTRATTRVYLINFNKEFFGETGD